MFFKMWWVEQSPAVQQDVKNLVKDGRFEFVNGGWVAHDEAGPTYNDIIENMRLGH